LKRNLKKVSPGYEIADDEENEHPKVKLERIFCQLEKLKNAPLDPSFDLHKDLEAEVLKDVYTIPVLQLDFCSLTTEETNSQSQHVFAYHRLTEDKVRPNPSLDGPGEESTAAFI
jgi:hypothetical protein